jgi:DNA replication protein DnaC
MLMAKPNQKLIEQLKYLRLKEIAELYPQALQKARKHNWAYSKFLEYLIDAQVTAKMERSIALRIRQARFPVIKTIDAFDFSFPVRIAKKKVIQLFDLNFIEEKKNVIILGPTGCGKSHLAAALAYKACEQGIRTLFSTAINIVNVLGASLSDQTFMKTLNRYTRPTLLTIDELGYLPIDKRGSDLLFQVIDRRYERGSIIITSNRPFKQWGKVFNDATIANAVIDRLIHHSIVITIEGDSYRMKGK